MGGLKRRDKMEQSVDHEEEGRTNQDHMNRLPDELLVVIINNILEAKSLFNLSLVSKRFASLIPHHNGTVSVTLPDPNTILWSRYSQFFVSFRRFLKRLGGTHHETPYFPVTHDNTFWLNAKNLPKPNIKAYHGGQLEAIKAARGLRSTMIISANTMISFFNP